jgi:hypothetical protein
MESLNRAQVSPSLISHFSMAPDSMEMIALGSVTAVDMGFLGFREYHRTRRHCAGLHDYHPFCLLEPIRQRRDLVDSRLESRPAIAAVS